MKYKRNQRTWQKQNFGEKKEPKESKKPERSGRRSFWSTGKPYSFDNGKER